MVKIQSKISTCVSLLEVNTVKPDNSVNFTTTIVDIVNGHPKVASRVEHGSINVNVANSEHEVCLQNALKERK